MSRSALPLLVTQGDPAGVGLELVLKLWQDREQLKLPPFAFVGSLNAMQTRSRDMGMRVQLRVIAQPDMAIGCFAEALPVIDHGLDAVADAGKPEMATAAGTIEAIRLAVELVRAGKAAGIITNPIAKSVLYAAGFAHPGHTEYLATLAAEPGAPAPLPVMLIWSELLAVVPVTIHIPLSEVPRQLTTDLIVRTAIVVDDAFRRGFGVPAPRLALAGLNPHAGESGALGSEDAAVIVPAVQALQERGIDARGPMPADTMFHARARAGYDVALTMYHDQGLIPAKTLAFDDGVNVTLGLPFVRTSPDHGTAFDIAGKGSARPDSLLAAIKLARRLADRQQA
ncbi:MAG: 4-hydroxythreonine-4-phosphate dehydrogenase PdxA [Bosea sp. (in: a-proteobacteria)]